MIVPVSKLLLIGIIAVMLSSCSSERDPYLRSLKLNAEPLTAVDSLNIDQFNLFQVRDVVKLDGDWLLMSSTGGDYKLLFLNTATSEHFFAIRKGRGPGEMIGGSSLHECGGRAIFYDRPKSVCIRINAKETIKSQSVVTDTISLFYGPSMPTDFMTTCGENGFISGNVLDDNVWYSYYDRTGNVISSVKALDFEEISKSRDHKISFLASCKYVSSPDGSRVCVASVGSPSLSFAEVSSGNLSEYKRLAVPPAKGNASETISAFVGIAADDDYVYLTYSGHKIRNDVLPSEESNHLIVYDWNGNPVKHYLLNRNVNSIHVDGKYIWASSTYPESCVYRFVLNGR